MNNRSFILKMVFREIRASWRHFGFFIFCLALGVSGVVSVGAVANQVKEAIFREAKGLLGGDIEIELNHPLSQAGVNRLAQLESKGVRQTVAYELMAMARESGHQNSQLIELKAVREGYPLYGTLLLDPPNKGFPLSGERVAWVEPSLLVQLGLKPGDRIQIGTADLTIAGVIKKEPDRITEGFSMGPRVLISEASLENTGLVKPGSRVRYRHLLLVPNGIDPALLVKELKESFAGEKATVESYQEAQPRLRKFLTNLGFYLGLIGMISLLIGGIGVGNSIHSYLRGKMDTLGILKCLGTTRRPLFLIYLIQSLVMGLLGCLAGASGGVLIHLALQETLKSVMPRASVYLFPLYPVLTGIVLGLLVVFLFSLFPLFRILDLKPAMVFRRDLSPWSSGLKGGARWAMIGGASAALGLFIVTQAGSFKNGLMFIGVFLISGILLRFTGWLLIRGVRKFHPASFTWRYGLSGLNRPGQFVSSVILSIGLATTVITAILLIRSGMIQQVTANIPVNAPALFFVDIQQDQKPVMEALIDEKYRLWGYAGGHDMNPILRGRIHSVLGRGLGEIKNNEQWFYQREYVLTFQKEPPAENKIIRGKWWTNEEGESKDLISMEEDVAKHLGISIGSTLAFEIQGQIVEGVVANIRQVNWENLRTNFFVIFSPHVFEGHSVTYIATSRSRSEEDLNYQKEVTSLFPNVTVINVRHILETLKQIMEKILLAISMMGGFTAGAGLLVLAGAIAATRYIRLREAVILKMLGATRGRIARLFLVEFIFLGGISAATGLLTGSLLAWLFLKYILMIDWKLSPLILAGVMASTVCLTLMVSFWMTRSLIRRKPLEILREN
ncbi:MAG TPA: FtsX-like permease family protein [Nitrospiria bacterium]|nr:FtsX-like permease family protein [Nitrospiria bacterium]